MAINALLVALAIPAMSMAAAIPQDIEQGVNIVGGVPAVAGDFPFIVSLQQDGSHFCGGSLLDADTVLTAAHCTVGQTASTLSVRAGSLNRASGGTLVKVSSIKSHPSFSQSTLDSDVAIWKLATSIPESSTVSYATLPAANSDPSAGTTATTAGWGTTSSGGSTLPAALRKVDVPIVSRADCRSSYGTSSVTNTMICAGLLEAGGKDSCQGDSGGPIIDASTKIQIGLVSWGEGCASPDAPGVYSRLSVLLSFINQNL